MITKAYVVTKEQAEFLEKLAEREDRSVSWIVRQIIDREMIYRADNDIIKKLTRERDEATKLD